jgi:hypothetical protein
MILSCEAQANISGEFCCTGNEAQPNLGALKQKGDLMRRWLCVGCLTIGMGQLMLASSIGIELGITDSGNFTSGDYLVINSSGGIVSSGGNVNLTTSNRIPGEITFNGCIGGTGTSCTGGWSAAGATGLGYPANPVGAMDLLYLVADDGTGTLDVEFSENGITTPNSSWGLDYDGTLSAPSGAASTSYSAYAANNDDFFAQTLAIGTVGSFASPGTFSGNTTGSVAGLTTPYSLTQVVQISGQGNLSYSGYDAELVPTGGGGTPAGSPVPEPSPFALFGTGLVAILLYSRYCCNRTHSER